MKSSNQLPQILTGAMLAFAMMNGVGAADLRFRAGTQGGFYFETGELRGQLRSGGKSLGLTEVVHVPTGLRLDQSNGLLSHYRVFANGKRFGGGAWDWPSTARLCEDGAVEVRWEATPDRPFALSTLYRWSGPATLDVETAVQARSALSGFEVFLASYATPGFSNALAFIETETDSKKGSAFVAAERSLGEWLIYPRDPDVVPLIQDGRWKLEPNPVTWMIQPLLAKPIGVRRDPVAGLTALFMAPAKDCFAIAMPHQSEGHYSLYLSLFGRDIPEGDRVSARARYVIARRLTDSQILREYERYMNVATDGVSQ